DEEGAIITLLEGNQWEEALRVINKYSRIDIIDTNFKPALLEASQRQLAFLQDNKALFTRHKDRLAVVRKEKAKACTEILGDDHADQDVDLYSDTSSTTRTHSSHSSAKYSATSKTSGRTAKSRRKAERKKLSLREGSPYEDHALLVALKDIVDAVDKSKDDVHNLLKMLVLFGFDCEAGVLQACLEGTLSLMDSCTAEIWQTGSGSAQTQMTLGPHSTVNSILASMNAGPQPVDPVPPEAGQLRRSDRVKRKPDWFHRDPRYGFRAPLPTAAATTTSGLSTPLPPPSPAAQRYPQHRRHPRPDLQHLSCRHHHQRQDSASPHRGQPTLRSGGRGPSVLFGVRV
ncbi:PREDICTED: putative elongator complex protein 1, partial [Branchiostoma belcheri]|uniref:Elongator complex protein 1 n=1 Tax=Branchiostoma belcheri TaxID=7741 RepID=A0A6P5A9H8_BRABE